MKKVLLILLFISFGTIPSYTQEFDSYQTSIGELKITPILHGSLVLELNDVLIFVDPYGGSQNYNSFSSPNMILITDSHGDHLNQKTLDGIDINDSEFIVPQVVNEKLPSKYKSTILKNGQGIHRNGLYIEAIPMYNLPENEASMHPKWRGNGYLLTFGDTNIYISGDTEDIPEMRMLRNIDIAFICMNLPYTMDINQAASAVLEFKPKVVYPYHYRGKDDFSDIEAFKKLVTSEDKSIEVKLKNWYPLD